MANLKVTLMFKKNLYKTNVAINKILYLSQVIFSFSLLYYVSLSNFFCSILLQSHNSFSLYFLITLSFFLTIALANFFFFFLHKVVITFTRSDKYQLCIMLLVDWIRFINLKGICSIFPAPKVSYHLIFLWTIILLCHCFTCFRHITFFILSYFLR